MIVNVPINVKVGWRQKPTLTVSVLLTLFFLGPSPVALAQLPGVPGGLAEPKPTSSLVVKPEVYFGLEQPIYSISLSPDGKTAAISGASSQKPVTIADITIPKILKTFGKDNKNIYKKNIFCVAFAPDGKTLATSGTAPRIWEASTWKGLKNLEQFSEMTGRLAYSPDGKFLATLETNRTVVLRDLSGAKEPVCFSMQKGKWFANLAYSPDGKTLAVGDLSGYVELRDLSAPVPFKDLGNQKPSLTLQCGRVGLAYVGFTTDSQSLVTGCGSLDGALVEIWDLKTGKVKYSWKLKGIYDSGPRMALSPDGKTVAIEKRGNYIDLYDLNTGQAWASLGPHLGIVKCIAFSRDGSTLVSGTSADYAYVFKVPQKK